MEIQKRAVCISGGGSFGAFSVGTLAALQRDYAIVAGVSTGSLMAPLVALGEYGRLCEAYTSVVQSDIFDWNPFRRNGKLHIPKALWRVVSGKNTLGDSGALRRTIDRFLTENDYVEITRRGKQVIVACQEIRREPERIEYFSSTDTAFEDFKDFMWASSNVPIVTSLMEKNGGEYTDAGASELLSLCQVIQMGATDVDVLIHRPRPEVRTKTPTGNVAHNFFRLFAIMRKAIEHDDLRTGLLEARLAGARVNVCWLPRKLADNSLMFDRQVMQGWFDEGYDTARDPARWDRYDFGKPEKP